MAQRRDPTPDAIATAAARLRAGGAVVFPTETVYGLGALTFDEAGLERVFTLKGRPRDNPLIAHVGTVDDARRVTSAWDERADALAARFWPGPLSLVLPKAADVPAAATGGRDTIAVRAPRHPVARALLAAAAAPISAPSANRSGAVSPTSAQHVLDDFPGEPDLIVLDGGPCAVGVESTVLDLTGAAARVLRPGSVTAAALREVLGAVAAPSVREQGASPGTSMSHYAPRTPAELVDAAALGPRLAELAAQGTAAVVLALDASSATAPHQALAMPRDADAYAQRLFAALREADAVGAALIVIERPAGEDDVWRAVLDRLARATARRCR